MDRLASPEPLFRLWITSYVHWRPQRWNEVPPRATALEPVAETAYSACDAAAFLRGFNSAMLSCDRALWAVAVPVELRYHGDVTAGGVVHGYVFAETEAATPG